MKWFCGSRDSESNISWSHSCPGNVSSACVKIGKPFTSRPLLHFRKTRKYGTLWFKVGSFPSSWTPATLASWSTNSYPTLFTKIPHNLKISSLLETISHNNQSISDSRWAWVYWQLVRDRRMVCRTHDNLGIWRRIRRYILGRYPAIWRLFSWNSHTFGKFSRTERCRRNGRARLDSRTETESEFWTTMLEALGKVPLLLSEHFQMFLHIITILKGCYQLSFILIPVMHALPFGSSPAKTSYSNPRHHSKRIPLFHDSVIILLDIIDCA